MKKRGRPRTLHGKTERIDSRVSPATRERLEASADAQGRSLSREIEQRLVASLDADDLADGKSPMTVGRLIAALEGIDPDQPL